MTIRLAVVSATNTDRILDQIEKISKGDLEIVLHLGGRTATFKASTLRRMTPTKATEGHLMQSSKYSGAAEPLLQSPEYFRLRDQFADHMNRNSWSHGNKSHPLKEQQDFHDYYHILCDTLASELLARRVTHVLFFNIPHLVYDTALYQVAKALELELTFMTQSIFPEKFWSMSDPAMLGDFPPGANANPVPIDKLSKPDLFYMKGVKQEREDGGTITAAAFAQFLVFLAMKRPLRALNPFYIGRLLRHMKKIYGSFPKWRDPFAKFFHEDELAYFDTLAQFEDQQIDLSGEFVYFPLQLQPEMTTSALGGRFRDQAYAIERLAGILPQGVRILVKENPKQGAYMRGPMFFHRLNRIPSVTILPSWANTHDLSARAKFVASITGTVGWEAIRQGVPALVFGKAWYRKLPGVAEWREGLTYDQVAGQEVDHSALEAAMGDLLARAHDGVVHRHYRRIVSDYDSAANDARVAETILGLITRSVPMTFGPAGR